MSASLVAALAVMAACQLFKVVAESARRRALSLGSLFSTGGMPSTHSAFVTALAVSVALWHGVSSEYFGITSVFAAIIVYDSIRLRGMVDLHTRILRDLQARLPGGTGIVIPRWVGHTAAETAVGFVVGVAGAAGAWFPLRVLLPGGILSL